MATEGTSTEDPSGSKVIKEKEIEASKVGNIEGIPAVILANKEGSERIVYKFL